MDSGLDPETLGKMDKPPAGDRADLPKSSSGRALGTTSYEAPGIARRTTSFASGDENEENRLSSGRSVTFSDINESIDIDSVPRGFDDDDEDDEDELKSRRSVTFNDVVEYHSKRKNNPFTPIVTSAIIFTCASVVIGTIAIRKGAN